MVAIMVLLLCFRTAIHMQLESKYFQPHNKVPKYFQFYPSILNAIQQPKQEMFRNTTFTPPIGKMTTLPRCRHKAVIRKSNFAVCMDLIIKFEFLRLLAKCALSPQSGSVLANQSMELHLTLLTRFVTESVELCLL